VGETSGVEVEVAMQVGEENQEGREGLVGGGGTAIRGESEEYRERECEENAAKQCKGSAAKE